MRGTSITSGECALYFEPFNNEFIPKVCVGTDSDARPVLTGEGFILLNVGDASAPVRITRVSGGDMLSFAGEFKGIPDWQVQGRVVPAGDQAPRFGWHVRLTYTGEEPVEYRAGIKLQVQDTGVPRWMIPAMFYEHNRPESCIRKYPRYSKDAGDPENFVSNHWAFRSDRSSCPSVFCWTDNFTSCLTTPERYSGLMSGLGFRGDESGTFLMLNFPYVEEPVKYSFCTADGTGPDRQMDVLLPNQHIDFTFTTFVGPRDLHAYDGVIRDIYNDSEDETNPWVTKGQADRLLSYGLHRWYYDSERHVLYETCAFDSYFSKYPNQVDRPHMHVAWVSGMPYAFALWRYGQEVGSKAYADAGISVIDKVADEGISPSGFFFSEWRLESGWGTGWNPNKDWLQARTTGEATWFLMQALEYAKQVGVSRPNWEAAVRSNLDSVLKVQRTDGNLGEYYNVNSGEVQEWDGAGGLAWIPALLAVAKYFGDQRYTDAAVRAGEYYARFVENEYIYGAAEDVHLAPTSEDGYNGVIAYTHLYEAVEDEKWLDYACSAADLTATFRWTYNTKFPESTILGKYDYRTLGGDIASPANNHLHNYGLICVPEFLRLWDYTGDTYYLSRAADHLACSHQFIARDDGDFNARAGMITEQWYHTDWTHPKGSMLQLAHSWCAGMVLYANAYAREFGELIIDAESREVYVLDSPWITAMEDLDPDLVLTLMNPAREEVSLTVRHSKLGVVGRIDLPPDAETRFRIGGTSAEIELLTPESEMWS